MRRNLIVFSMMVATGSVSLPAGLAVAGQVEFPARKTGQWELKMVPGTAGAAPAMSIQLCLDAATDAAMMQNGLSLSAGMCPEINATQDGDTIVIDAKCKIGAMKTTSHTVISGDFQSAYSIQITSDIEGAPKGMPTHSVINQQATWVGECAEGMQPGDMLMPGGRKINVKAMSKMLGGGG